MQGNATVTLAAGTDSLGNPTQIYTIVNSGVITTVTTNVAANTTTLVTGGTTRNLIGVPKNMVSLPGSPATMLYVDGSIPSLRGAGGQGSPAIQDGAAVTITAGGSITITGDILYKTEPVTLANNQIPGTPADTLIPGNDKGQTLGIFTSSGNVNLDNAQANGSLEIDASVATICAEGIGAITNIGPVINTLNIVGGRSQNTIQNINTAISNVFFDRRYTPGSNFSPPWFPSATIELTPPKKRRGQITSD